MLGSTCIEKRNLRFPPPPQFDYWGCSVNPSGRDRAGPGAPGRLKPGQSGRSFPWFFLHRCIHRSAKKMGVSAPGTQPVRILAGGAIIRARNRAKGKNTRSTSKTTRFRLHGDAYRQGEQLKDDSKALARPWNAFARTTGRPICIFQNSGSGKESIPTATFDQLNRLRS